MVVMSDIEIIIYTACATLIGGVILLILTELIKSFVVSPVQKVREQIPTVLSRLDFHCNMLTNYFPTEPSDEEWATVKAIKKDLREAATDLNSLYKMVPFKKVLSLVKFVPGSNEIGIAYSGLIYLHNSILFEGRRDYIINQIDMNKNQIDRIQAALTHGKIPSLIKLKERS